MIWTRSNIGGKSHTYDSYYAKCDRKDGGELYCIQRISRSKFKLYLFYTENPIGAYSKLRYAKNAAERHNSQ